MQSAFVVGKSPQSAAMVTGRHLTSLIGYVQKYCYSRSYRTIHAQPHFFFSSSLGGSGLGVGKVNVSGFRSCPGPTCAGC